MMSDYNVEMINDGLNEFNVEFHGPKESMLICSTVYVLWDRSIYMLIVIVCHLVHFDPKYFTVLFTEGG